MPMPHNGLTNEEFLSVTDELTQKSPVIRAFHQRLAEAVEALAKTPDQFKCPVCEAPLQFDPDSEADILVVISGC